MLLAAVLLSATLAPPDAPVSLARPGSEPAEAAAKPAAAPAERKPAPKPLAAATEKPAQAAPGDPESARPVRAAAEKPEAAPKAAASPTSGGHLEAGLAAFRRHRLAAAKAELEQALAGDPQSAAANYYLGYACYKIGEPARRMNENKTRALELFDKAFSLDPTFTPVWGTARAARPAGAGAKPAAAP